MNDAEITRWLCEAASIADILRRLREAQQLTVKEVAEYAALAPSYVSMLEHGTKRPGRDTLVALLLAGFSLPVGTANRILLFAGFAPMHHHLLAINAQSTPRAIRGTVFHHTSAESTNLRRDTPHVRA
jgi:transcriptional regulator with XRE-family HTH domain